MSVTKQQVQHVAALANIPVSDRESEQLAAAFSETLTVVDQLKQVDVAGASTTHQVTGLHNVLREDVVHPELSFTQAEALANAKTTHQGYFVVPYVLHNKDN